MKLKNVHYEYRENDTWRIYFNDYKECETFQNERSDVKKPMCSAFFTNNLGIRYYVEAKLTGQFSILRRYVRDGSNKYFSNDAWTKLVKKIEGTDSDYVFDEIDLRYDATIDKCYFRICCMNGTWTELFVKNMLNSQFGMAAQANGYYDTDTVGEGGLCIRRSCCGIGFDQSTYKTSKERIMFSVKDYCPGGKADIIKVGAWTNTFIGTNKENEREYSWVDFKQYVQKLSATGSDIWDIEWEYDAACPMTGTEIADELHLYLKPLAYNRLFEKKEKEEDDLLKNITDVSLSTTKDIGCSTLYYYNLYFDDWSDLKYVSNRINRNMFDYFKGAYYIRVVSYNKELPKNISSARLVWNQEENGYSVKDFTIKGYRSEGNRIWLSTGTLWSNNDYIGRVQALTPPPVPKWAKLDEDGKIGFRQKDMDEVKKEIDEMTKRIYEKLEIKQVKDFDTATAWHEYLTASAEFNAFINDINNKEEKNMGPKDTTFSDFCRRLYWGAITAIKPKRILVQGTATIIWWSDGTKTIVKCQKGDKMDPEKGIAMCVMKKFMGTNETHSNYLDFAKDAIAKYEKQKQADAKKRKQAADKKRRVKTKAKAEMEPKNKE